MVDDHDAFLPQHEGRASLNLDRRLFAADCKVKKSWAVSWGLRKLSQQLAVADKWGHALGYPCPNTLLSSSRSSHTGHT